MNFQEHREIINKLKRQLTTPPSYDMLSVLLSELQYTMEDNPELSVADRDFVITYSGYIKKWATTMYVETMEQQWDDLYWRTMLFEAPYLFESYLIYMEKDRNPEKRFYLPRRKSLKVVVDDLQDLEDGKLDFTDCRCQVVLVSPQYVFFIFLGLLGSALTAIVQWVGTLGSWQKGFMENF